MKKIPLLPETMGKLIIERKESGKSVADYADGAMDMYNAFIKMLNEQQLIIIKKGKQDG